MVFHTLPSCGYHRDSGKMSPIVYAYVLFQIIYVHCGSGAGRNIESGHRNRRLQSDFAIDDTDNNYINKRDRYPGVNAKHQFGENMKSRRLFDWVYEYFTTTAKTPVTSIPTTTVSNYENTLDDRIFLQALHNNLTQVMKKLTDIDSRVVQLMKRKENHSYLLKKHSKVSRLRNQYRRRIKREIELGDIPSSTDITLSNASTKLNTNTTEETSNSSINNVTQVPCEKSNDMVNGRRFGTFGITPTDVKMKLLTYLEESFQEIRNKIASLKSLKQSFSDNDRFKIGYIVANIDTLEINMLNLKKDMDSHKQFWEDKHILDLYDTVKVSNRAVSGLIDSLNGYLQKLSNEPQKFIPQPNVG